MIPQASVHTGKLKFRDVIATIRKFAFVASAFPLILSLEVHCSLQQQVCFCDGVVG